MATTDGMPLVWLAHKFGFKEATRVYGPDLMLALCAATADPLKSLNPLNVEDVETVKPFNDLNEPAGHLNESGARLNAGGSRPISHFFYGATDEVLEQLRENLLKKFPKLEIAGMYSPPFRPLTDEEKGEIADRINAAKPDIVWCGLGTPKQDYWVAEFRPRLDCAAILAVGAAFNFHAGQVRQAPPWMMKIGLEWMFRLCVEPRRLWRRYIIGNPRFVLQTLKQVVRARGIRRRMAS